MKKRILSITTVLLLAVMFAAVPAFASLSGNFLCVDPQYVISDEDLNALGEKMEEISERQECEVVAYTTDSFDGQTATEYADDYFDDFRYGYGEDRDGILLVVNTEDREWAISTHGDFGIAAFTDAGQEYIMDQVLTYLAEDDYAGAFDKYATLCDEFLTQAHTGEPYDKGNLPGQEKGIIIILDIIVGIIIGVVVGLLIVGRDKKALKTVRRETEAKNYLRDGSLNVVVRRENFLYNTVDTIRKEKNEGSSTHTSSSGERHGGSSGKF